MRKSIAVSALALAGFASLSVAQTQLNQSTQNRLNQAQQLPQQEEQGPQHVQKCIREASSDNLYEIQAGQFIEQRAQDPQVKQLAQKLIQDHQQAEQQLQQAAQQLGIQVSQQLSPVHQAKLQELEQKQGPALERTFVFGTVGGHETDILTAQWQAEHEQAPQLKQYAQQQIPVLEEHLRMARQVADQWVPQAHQAGEHMRGTQQQQQNINR